MNLLKKTLLGAVIAGGAALSLAAPASAAVHVGIGIAGPAPHSRVWCHHHPRACGYHAPRVYYVPGHYYRGHGWWDGHRWYHNRYRWHGHWRYR